MWRQRRSPDTPVLDVRRIRRSFAFASTDRVVTNNAATTQPPRELLYLYRELAPRLRERPPRAVGRVPAHDGAVRGVLRHDRGVARRPRPAQHRAYRNTTEAINAVMYTLLTEFRDGDNVVTTLLEHNSNYVPWYALCREILPRLGRRVECRLARFDHATGAWTSSTWRPWSTSAPSWSPAPAPRTSSAPSHRWTSSARSPTGAATGSRGGERRSLLLVDAAQLVPSTAVDVQALDVDYLAFSFHKLLAPFGVGVLYAKEHLLERGLPFLYGGDMIAEGRVTPELVEYNDLPWKYSAGTPNILGVVVSAQALRLVLDLVLRPAGGSWFRTARAGGTAGRRRRHAAGRRPHPLAHGAGARRAPPGRRPDRLRPRRRRPAVTARGVHRRRDAIHCSSPRSSTRWAWRHGRDVTAPPSRTMISA